ncbi:MAG: hypothetical protein ACE5KO_06775 [Candidatus Bathyarchaeia archaeon]
MSPRLELTQKFFERTSNRDFAEAERILIDIKDKMASSIWSQGYFVALQGILTAYKGKDDRYTLINKLDEPNEKMPILEKEFYDRSKSITESDFDRGFFSAWTDILRFIMKTKIRKGTQPQNQKSETTTGTELTEPSGR